jgi:hemolysin D
MSVVYYRSRRGLDKLAEEHPSEGVAILAAEPSRLMRGTIIVLFGLLIAGMAWSVYGRMDIIVQATGIVNPESELHEVYVPIKGELVNIYVTEGMPVTKGDVLARINSPSAIEVAGQATQANVNLLASERAYELFPARKKATEKDIAAVRAKLQNDQEDHERQISEALARVGEEQRLKLEKARAKLAKAAAERDQAKRVLDQHERLFASPGGGGISRDQVEEKKKSHSEKMIDYRLAEAELGEFESTMSQEYTKKKAEIEKKSQELLSTQAQYENMMLRLAQDEAQAESDVRVARSKARAASRVSYEDIDEDNFLRIRAPVDGIVTTVTYKNVGGQIEDKTPVATIAAKNARKVLEIEVNERDRAFLEAGMPVKIKLNAFPYQRYGILNGELEYVAPASTMNQQSKQLIYKARVGLERDHFMINNVPTPIRYGMAASVEIVVGNRRVADLALNPFKDPV